MNQCQKLVEVACSREQTSKSCKADACITSWILSELSTFNYWDIDAMQCKPRLATFVPPLATQTPSQCMLSCLLMQTVTHNAQRSNQYKNKAISHQPLRFIWQQLAHKTPNKPAHSVVGEPASAY